MSAMPDLEQMCRDHFNEPMLSSFEVVRCIGYGEDEHDCYVIMLHRGGKRTWHTCVGGYIFLDALRGQDHIITGVNEYDDLGRLDSMLSLNGAPKQDEFLLELRDLTDLTPSRS